MLSKPEGLSALGSAAYDEAMKLVREHGLDPCGCKTFYSPQEWRARGERYGLLHSHLIIVYDGGDIGSIAQLSGRHNQAFIDALSRHGLYVEEGTGWYACIHNI